MRFFADQDAILEVEFPDDGVTVFMRQFMDEGIVEDVRNESMKMILRDGNTEVNREVRLNAGDLLTLQKMITKVVTLERTYTAPIGMTLLRKMRPDARAKLIGLVNENNPLESSENAVMTET